MRAAHGTSRGPAAPRWSSRVCLLGARRAKRRPVTSSNGPVSHTPAQSRLAPDLDFERQAASVSRRHTHDTPTSPSQTPHGSSSRPLLIPSGPPRFWPTFSRTLSDLPPRRRRRTSSPLRYPTPPTDAAQFCARGAASTSHPTILFPRILITGRQYGSDSFGARCREGTSAQCPPRPRTTHFVPLPPPAWPPSRAPQLANRTFCVDAASC